MTTSASRGRLRCRSRRLCSRAPETTIWPEEVTPQSLGRRSDCPMVAARPLPLFAGAPLPPAVVRASTRGVRADGLRDARVALRGLDAPVDLVEERVVLEPERLPQVVGCLLPRRPAERHVE